MGARDIGRMLMGLGLLLVLVGLVVSVGGFRWFGRLPGDLRFEGEHTRVYVPWVSMLLISAALSLVASLVRRLF